MIIEELYAFFLAIRNEKNKSSRIVASTDKLTFTARPSENQTTTHTQHNGFGSTNDNTMNDKIFEKQQKDDKNKNNSNNLNNNSDDMCEMESYVLFLIKILRMDFSILNDDYDTEKSNRIAKIAEHMLVSIITPLYH